jgi:hypothetical protein
MMAVYKGKTPAEWADYWHGRFVEERNGRKESNRLCLILFVLLCLSSLSTVATLLNYFSTGVQ